MSGLREERAQGVIEFALLATLLLLFFLGTVDFARFLYYDNAIRSAARTGAEIATNHCAHAGGSCGLPANIVTDDYVVQAVHCETNPYVNLSPSPSTCTPCNGAPCTSPCTGTCITSICSGRTDICISPSGPPGSPRSAQQTVIVTVGYDFRPITPLMSQFFQSQSCWTGDSTATNQHTLCAQSVGRVF